MDGNDTINAKIYDFIGAVLFLSWNQLGEVITHITHTYGISSSLTSQV